MEQVKLVVKPDMLFGQRGKNDLVGLNLTYAEAEAFIRARMNKEVIMGVGVASLGGGDRWGAIGLKGTGLRPSCGGGGGRHSMGWFEAFIRARMDTEVVTWGLHQGRGEAHPYSMP